MFDLLAPPMAEDTCAAADWRAGFGEQTDRPDPQYSPAQAQPSGWLALELDAGTADTDVLGDTELVDAIVAFDHVTSWAAARQTRLLAEFARRRPGDDPTAVGCDKPWATSRYAPDEIALALGQSRLTAKSRLAQAVQLTGVLPDTLHAWENGRIDAPKVRALCDATSALSPDLAAAVAHRVLPRAPGQSLAQLRAALARAIAAVDPDGAAARHREARKDRRVVLGDQTDGMASLWALLAAPDATSAYQWLSRLARSLGADDPRPMDARRADLLVELLTGQLTIVPTEQTTPTGQATEPTTTEPTTSDGCSSDDATGADNTDADTGSADTGKDGADTGSGSIGIGIGSPRRADARPVPATPGKPLIHIVMPHSTLIGADDHPADLVGYGPIPADLAREIAADAIWKRLVTDPVSGALLDHGRTTYRPPQPLADFIRARDVECRFPTCRRRTIDTELDHNRAWADLGTTSEDNLWGGCPHHHHLKHDAGWTVALHPDASMTWTTPTGHSYTSEPHDYRPERLTPSRASPPADPAPARPTPGPSFLDLLNGTATAPIDDTDPPPF